MVEQAEPFWIVWNPAGSNPQYRHATEGAARGEARRLARENPGAEFIVMQSISQAVFRGVVVTDFKPPIPF